MTAPRRLLLGATLGLAGCSILPGRPYLQRRDWPLLVQRPATLPPRAGARVLLVRDVTPGPGLDARGLAVLQPDGSLRTDFYEQWLVPPAEGVTESLRAWLATSGRFAAVLAPDTRLPAALVLEAELTTLLADPAHGTSRAALALVLAAGPRVLLQRTLQASAPLAGTDAPGVAASMLAALGVLLGMVEEAVGAFG